jgi:hypothetical protein
MSAAPGCWGRTLLFHGHSYPLVIGGMSFGATIVCQRPGERAYYHLRAPADVEGIYSAIGAGVAVTGGVRLQNARGVVLELSGARVGVESSVAMSGVTVRLRQPGVAAARWQLVYLAVHRRLEFFREIAHAQESRASF